MAGTAKNKAIETNLDSAVETQVESTVNSVEVKEQKVEKKTKETLNDTDLILCTSQIPNLSYVDKKTGDMYEWNNVGDTEEIRFDTLKDMYRSYGSYIKNLYFTFSDERVISHFRMENVYDNYTKMLDVSMYSREKINELQETIKTLPRGIINTVLNRVKALVTSGEISDIQVIRSLEKIFDIDLIFLLDR